MTKVTVKDVARRAGVHPATVSRALNPATSGLVRPDTVRRVRQAAKALGYRPNPAARTLRTSRTHTVGMLIPDLTNPLFPPIVRGAESVLEARGYTVLVVNTDDDRDKQATLLTALADRRVDGLIVCTAWREDAALAATTSPLVLVSRAIDGVALPKVLADDAEGVGLSVAHLASLGHRRIAYLAGPGETSPGLVRLRAFRQAMADHGLPQNPRLTVECAGWSERHGAAALAALLDGGERFTAVMAGNDLLALGCLDTMAARGLSCPDDLSLVGFNDMPYAGRLSPPLTTVTVPRRELGAEAGRLLIERIEGSDTPVKAVTLPVTLAARGSTAPCSDISP
ncbi:LacI family DNA-binding transcriptional regulator [Nonomuraea sp. NPDC050790]|uniref:LacI family DNA-binding transcriptional regulator n=1 Tax=Nonomuraea sp. NPDC050790 TaxID=3364371 RepID=UPI0037B59E29